MVKNLWPTIKQAGSEWMEDKAMKLAASLSYYTAFSLAPLLVIAVAILGFIYGKSASGQVTSQLRTMMGDKAARATEEMIKNSSAQSSGVMATVLSIVILLLGASGVFGELQDSMNTIWEVKPKPDRGIWGTVKDRFFSLTMVFGTIFVLMVSMIASAFLNAMGKQVLGDAHWIARTLNELVSFGVVTVLFAGIFKFIPDVKIRWKDVWPGAIVTAALFTLGKYLLGLYIGRTSTTSAYGAAGSFAALLIWVYYSAQILFFGAEFTQVYARRDGKTVKPKVNAEPLTEEKREQLGIPRKPAPPPPRAVVHLDGRDDLIQQKAKQWIAWGLLAAVQPLIVKAIRSKLEGKANIARRGMDRRVERLNRRMNDLRFWQTRAKEAELGERLDLIEERVHRANQQIWKHRKEAIKDMFDWTQ